MSGNRDMGAMMAKALPPKFVIRAGQWVWTTMWKIMMSNLAPRDRAGSYIRPSSEFRDSIGDQRFPPESGRYRLYVGMSCPWAHRTLVVRALKGLQEAIPVTVVYPSPTEGGWVFTEPEASCQSLAEFYQKAQPGYEGRSTVPMLWDSKTEAIVNNESAEIIVMLNDQFNEFAGRPELDLYPEALQSQIDQWNAKIYPAVNNGVYRCGFAQTQQAYDHACEELFSTLEEIESTLENNRYLSGDRVTLADVRLFTTLFRFDAAYFGLFKCNRHRIRDYPNLNGYLRDIYQLPGVSETCDIEAVKRDYYGNLFPLNPGGIIPSGPETDSLWQPHHREAKLSFKNH
ncbi:Glutathione transferase [Halothece sp. PCC 7418]|uniref:glutathione S-transferase family protein n=1 Tax=Halothece sp. (strain PCC 7418) TaxID=65093 RepID=UPI0002A06B10|nr:glutathione S-transferase family protein [Halothece sp. PCC 7418]AFZ45704.1 Glutathione transferase [Halothece sp. PCC 7418]